MDIQKVNSHRVQDCLKETHHYRYDITIGSSSFSQLAKLSVVIYQGTKIVLLKVEHEHSRARREATIQGDLAEL
jgi:hypothetical protein